MKILTNKNIAGVSGGLVCQRSFSEISSHLEIPLPSMVYNINTEDECRQKCCGYEEGATALTLKEPGMVNWYTLDGGKLIYCPPSGSSSHSLRTSIPFLSSFK